MATEEQVIARLRLICGESHVLTSPGELAAYSPAGTGGALVAVVVPGTITEVVSTVSACTEAGLAYGPRGAGAYSPRGAGGAGGAADEPAGVLITLARLRAEPAVDPAAGHITALAGTPVAMLRRAAPPGSSVLPELSAPGVTTIGGALAAGLGRSSLLALELVVNSGELVKLDRASNGYDLAGEFVGSRGRRGIMVRTTLRMSATSAVESLSASASAALESLSAFEPPTDKA